MSEAEQLKAKLSAAYAAKTRAEDAELAAVQERDELAAHVERYLLIDPQDRDIRDEIARVHEDSPKASLAHLKAHWQAEALERYSRIITEEWINKGESYGLRTASGQALLQAAELRRQAEGDAQ